MKCLSSKCSEDGKVCALRLRSLKFNEDEIADAVSLYGLKLKTVHKDINIEGSPERTDFRAVIEDDSSRLFIIERIPHRAYDTKRRIAKALDFLHNRGLKKIQPYVFNKRGEHISHYRNCFWQMVPFVDGVELPRPDYVYDKWRGGAFADFLIQLREKSVGMPCFEKEDVFSVRRYIAELWEKIKSNKPGMADKLLPVINFLEADFFKIYDGLPKAFSHGDFHPLNMVWGANDINVVIDWEFTGSKSEIYDLANMVGCVGIEDPNSLTGELVVGFIKKMKTSGIISGQSWEYLFEAVLAQRFAWLSEWLRKDDVEMQEMEEEYMKLLIQKRDILRDCWSSLVPSGEARIFV